MTRDLFSTNVEGAARWEHDDTDATHYDGCHDENLTADDVLRALPEADNPYARRDPPDPRTDLIRGVARMVRDPWLAEDAAYHDAPPAPDRSNR